MKRHRGRLIAVAAAAIPESAAPDKGTAKTQIEASPAFLAIADNSAPLVATNAYNAWFDELLRLVQNDHDTHGPCQAAEESITKPLKQAIEERAVAQRWVGAKPQVTLPVGTQLPSACFTSMLIRSSSGSVMP